MRGAAVSAGNNAKSVSPSVQDTVTPAFDGGEAASDDYSGGGKFTNAPFAATYSVYGEKSLRQCSEKACASAQKPRSFCRC